MVGIIVIINKQAGAGCDLRRQMAAALGIVGKFLSIYARDNIKCYSAAGKMAGRGDMSVSICFVSCRNRLFDILLTKEYALFLKSKDNWRLQEKIMIF